LIQNAETVYNNIINSVSEDLKDKYRTSSEKNVAKIKEYFISIQPSLSVGNGAQVMYQTTVQNNVYYEVIKIIDNDSSIIFNSILEPIDEVIAVIPDSYTNILDLKPISEEEQLAQLEMFYNEKYPEAAAAKEDLLNLGFEDAKFTTSFDGISVYATRPSKSVAFEKGIVDEVMVFIRDGWLSEASLIGCISKSDFLNYGKNLMQSYVEELEFIIQNDFVLEYDMGLGSYENVTDDWEFYFSLDELEVDDVSLVTISLTAKKH
jgi:hypothetical protein